MNERLQVYEDKMKKTMASLKATLQQSVRDAPIPTY